MKPPVGSSSGPPGACMTPSSVMKERTIIFLIKSTPCNLWVMGDRRYRQVSPMDLVLHVEKYSMRTRKKLLRSCSSCVKCMSYDDTPPYEREKFLRGNVASSFWVGSMAQTGSIAARA